MAFHGYGGGHADIQYNCAGSITIAWANNFHPSFFGSHVNLQLQSLAALQVNTCLLQEETIPADFYELSAGNEPQENPLT